MGRVLFVLLRGSIGWAVFLASRAALGLRFF